ncbi:MAG: glucosamine-6-phosphate deaminase [Christensenellales bacterium]
MKVIVTKNYSEMSAKAYEVIKQVMQDTQGKAILGLATGSTPIGLYKNMVADYQAGNVSYKQARSVNLDEYVGLQRTHDQSYYYFMHDNLFDHIDIDESNVNLPDGNSGDTDKACAEYTALLADMQQDVQVLGIGSNGHIGFNEPGTPFDSTTHIVKLHEGTRADNARFFDSLADVPTHAITMGIANIMNAKKILVLASGQGKANAVKAMVQGPVDPACPASVLQNHSDVVVVVDEAAASLLN